MKKNKKNLECIAELEIAPKESFEFYKDMLHKETVGNNGRLKRIVSNVVVYGLGIPLGLALVIYDAYSRIRYKKRLEFNDDDI